MHTILSGFTLAASTVVAGKSSVLPVVFLYFGPEVMLPVASFLAAAAGVILMFWRQILVALRKGFRMVMRREDPQVEMHEDLDMDLSITTTSSDASPAPKGERE